MIAPNTILQDRYRIVRLLGKGGMGAVYEAIDQRVSCVVALKEYTVGPQSDTRHAFKREAALLANLRHSALPKVMDYFDDDQGDFLVMEYIPGLDLAEMMDLRGGPFPPDQVLRWVIELLKLLEYLHTREPPILHRDIKPANLKVTKQDEVFLLDFGLAKGAAGQMATIETSKSVPGYTPVYAPIEQILGQGTDPRSDLYSLGATIFHLLTGSAPVSAPARFDAVENDRPDPLPPANKLNTRVSAEVSQVIQRAMALSRKDRHAGAREMRTELEAAAARDQARAAAEDALVKTLPYSLEIDPSKPIYADEDVQFTVFAPERIKPEKSYPVLAFAHLSKRRADAAENEPDPIEEMKQQAARILGAERDQYGEVKDDSRQPVPRGGELTFVPFVEGLTFSPPSRNLTWRKSVHREEFDVWATREVDGQTVKGSMRIFLGSLIIAEVGLSFICDSQAMPAAEKISPDRPQSARRVRQVFASYSEKDEPVVAELAHVAPIFGSRFLMDRTHLEPGEDRQTGLQRLIRDADSFQLFWSTNSMRSPAVMSEIDYALSLRRPGFILPTYWEEPVPRSTAEGLPPQEIDRLHFYRIHPGEISRAPISGARQSLVVNGPAGAEVYVDDERQGSIGSSGRIILKSIATGQHVLRITRSGEIDDERLVEIRAEPDEQIIQAQFRPTHNVGAAAETFASFEESAPPSSGSDSPTGSLAPMQPTIAAAPASFAAPAGSPPFGVVACTRCQSRYAAGITLCGRCGNTSFAPVAVEPIDQATIPAFAAPPRQRFATPPSAKPKRKLMMPILAGTAMVLFAVIVIPAWLVMKQTLGTKSAMAPNGDSPTAPRLNVPNAAGIEFVAIPQGSFMMGSENGADDEKPVHSVTISHGFFLAKYEVTQAQWEAVMGQNPSHYRGANRPVEQVSWDDANAFIARLNAKNDGFLYRLPTEAEWEYAARAGTTTNYYWGDDSLQACRYANVADQSAQSKYPDAEMIQCQDGYPDSAPVGSFLANKFGLYDMSGNVAEWCQDLYAASAYRNGASTDPRGPDSGKIRVMRGGAFGRNTSWLRSASRAIGTQNASYSNTGFRVAATARSN